MAARSCSPNGSVAGVRSVLTLPESGTYTVQILEEDTNVAATYDFGLQRLTGATQ